LRKSYETHDTITLELLNSINPGDLIKCNDWKSPLKVLGAAENYFLMERSAFGQKIYSVWGKKLAAYSRNNFSAGLYRVGRDNFIFGPPSGTDWDTPGKFAFRQ